MMVGGVRRNLDRPQDNQSEVFERKSTGVGSVGLNSKVGGKRPFGAVGQDIISGGGGGSFKANQTIE
jgi:hypothetical protein